ncbi:hypothetical protein ACI6PS_03545 [Flavobacterium sp. PLA-1-15]|uniref:hypothetical protein n=1 Tax=Flavobacterium sp. PLA-1-15 TaxID=3380533 RepID=UPI003B7E9131
MSNVDRELWRPIEPGTEFDHLLPKTFCDPTYVGEGLTDFSIQAMEDNILEYAWQTEDLADVLQKQTLNSTCLAVHEFLYKHIQYLSDKNDQLLRSPACSWYTRKEGIDCKSYSIFASCLLLNLGITHYIRKIKQPWYEPEEYTHVYVIVPTDQTNGSLSKGYHVIDGTIRENKEPAFIGFSDLKMSGMKHYSLNGATNGLNGGISLSALKDLTKSINLKSLKSIWSAIDCIGGSGFTDSMSRTSLANIDKFYQDWFLRFNTAIKEDNSQLTSYLVAEFKGRSTAWLAASEKKKTQDYNSCTTKRIQGNIFAFKFYKEVVGAVLDAYMDEYFNKVSGTFPQDTTFSNEGSEAPPFSFHYTYTQPYFVNTQPKQLYTPNIQKSIPAFIPPQYVVDQANVGQPINLDTVLNLIETAGNVIRTVAPASGGGTKPGVIVGGTKPIFDGSVKYTPGGATTKTAGLGTIAGWGIVLGGLAFAFSKMGNAGPGAKATKTRKSSTTKSK